MIHVDQVRSSRSQGENVPFRLRIHVLNMHSESRDADGSAKRAHNDCLHNLLLIVCQVLCAKVVGLTQLKGDPPTTAF